MGTRRLGRKRMFSLDKKGQSVELNSGPGIADAIVEATQRREGHQLITEIAVDLGTSKATIISSGTGANGDRSPVGVDDELAYVTQLTEAKFGVITEVRAVVLETPNSVADLDLEFGNDTAGKSDSGGAGTTAAGATSILTGLTAKGADTSTTYDANELSGKYLYIAQGANDTSEAFTTGKLVITLYGHVEPASI